MRCYKCGGKLEQHMELIIHNGKTVPQRILRCMKCGKAVTHIDDYEKTRKQIHPSFIGRIRGFFGNKTYFIDLSKGKVL